MKGRVSGRALGERLTPQSYPEPAWPVRKGFHGSLAQAKETRKRIHSAIANGKVQTSQIQVLLLQPFSPSYEKKAVPTGNLTFCCQKGSRSRVWASAGKRRGASREEPGDTESLIQQWQDLPKFRPRFPGTGCCQHRDGDHFERGKFQGLQPGWEEGAWLFPARKEELQPCQAWF